MDQQLFDIKENHTETTEVTTGEEHEKIGIVLSRMTMVDIDEVRVFDKGTPWFRYGFESDQGFGGNLARMSERTSSENVIGCGGG